MYTHMYPPGLRTAKSQKKKLQSLHPLAFRHPPVLPHHFLIAAELKVQRSCSLSTPQALRHTRSLHQGLGIRVYVCIYVGICVHEFQCVLFKTQTSADKKIKCHLSQGWLDSRSVAGSPKMPLRPPRRC